MLHQILIFSKMSIFAPQWKLFDRPDQAWCTPNIWTHDSWKNMHTLTCWPIICTEWYYAMCYSTQIAGHNVDGLKCREQEGCCKRYLYSTVNKWWYFNFVKESKLSPSSICFEIQNISYTIYYSKCISNALHRALHNGRPTRVNAKRGALWLWRSSATFIDYLGFLQ